MSPSKVSVGQVRPGMLCASWNRRGKAAVFGIPVLLAALLDQPVSLLRGDHGLRLVGGRAKHPHRVIMRQHDIFDRLVGDGAHPLDHLVGHRRRRLRVEHEAAVIADDDRRIRIALRRKGIEIGADLGEGDFLLRHVGRGRKSLFNSLGHRFQSCFVIIVAVVVAGLLPASAVSPVRSPRASTSRSPM